MSLPTSARPVFSKCAAAVIVLAAMAIVIAAPRGTLGSWTYLVIVIGAAGVGWWGTRRAQRSSRSVAVLIALGVTLSAGADLVWQILVWVRGQEPEISVADFGYVGSYVAIAAALLLVQRAGNGPRLDVDGVIDVAAVIVVTMVVQWELALHEIVTDTTVPVFVRLVWAAYPTLDAVLLALLLRAVVAGRVRGSMALLIAAGAVCWLASDFGFTLFAVDGLFAGWLDAGWMLGATLLAAAAWQPAPSPAASQATEAAAERPRFGGIALALLPLLVPPIIGGLRDPGGEHARPIPLFVAGLLLVGIAFLRAARLLRSESEARALVRSRERYSNAIAMNSSDAVVVVDPDATILLDAPRLTALLGRTGAGTTGVDLISLVAPLDAEDVRAILARCLRAPGQTFDTELRVQHHDTRTLWLAARMVNLLDDPDVGGVVINLHDITDRKRVEDELTHQAFHDGLTGLANRALLTDRVEQALGRSVRSGCAPAVIFLDLDGFKMVNDSLGHGPGDTLLKEVGRRLKSATRTGDTVARLGGDEFAILIENSPETLDEARSIGDRVLQALALPIPIGDHTITVSASIGIAKGDPDATAASLLRDADVAMYRAKAAGKSRWMVYAPEMRSAAVERLLLETDLVGALDRGQLRLMYQPVIDLGSERIVGFEALLRWHHPSLGVISPDKFIPVAESNGLIVPIGRWVLEQACQTANRWRRDYPEYRELSMAVNISGRQITSSDLIVHVAEALARSGLEPTALVLEMTETALVQDAADAADRLHELRALGVRLAIDDFGTGYSSLSYLRQFPVDILKIDRSFINAITDQQQMPAIVRGLIDLGRTLELETVAEGVEEAVQRDQLRSEQCDLAQGFLFSPPLEPADAELLLLQPRSAGTLGRATTNSGDGGPATRTT